MDVESVEHEGMWYVKVTRPGNPTSLYSSQQAEDLAKTIGDDALAEKLEEAAALTRKRNALIK
jgi:hypothetical protein